MPPVRHNRAQRLSPPLYLPGMLLQFLPHKAFRLIQCAQDTLQQVQAGLLLPTSTYHAMCHYPHFCSQHSLNSIFTAPNDQLRPLLTHYFNLGMNDKEVAKSVMDHFDRACYGFRCVLPLSLS